MREALQVLACLVLQALTHTHAAELAKCSAASVSPTAGLCKGKTFTYRVCTGSSPLYQMTENALKLRSADLTAILGTYDEYNCTADITATCKAFLPSTSVSLQCSIKGP